MCMTRVDPNLYYNVSTAETKELYVKDLKLISENNISFKIKSTLN